MTTPEIPTHIHLHPHGTHRDYTHVADLLNAVDDPYLMLLPEVPKGEVVQQLQSMSDGNKQMLDFFLRHDQISNSNFVTDQNASRMRAMAEMVFDTGVVVVSIHPTFNDRTAALNDIALGKDQRLRPTLPEAIVSLSEEIPEIAKVIKKRDAFSAKNFRSRVVKAIRNVPEFEGLERIRCLMEIGSLHFQLPSMLQQTGEDIDVSGIEGTDASLGAHANGISTILRGGSIKDIDLERIAMEDLLANIIFSPTTVDQQRAIDIVLDSQPRSTWSDLYRDQVSALHGRK